MFFFSLLPMMSVDRGYSQPLLPYIYSQPAKKEIPYLPYNARAPAIS
jgi:hypothetical protein